MLPVPSSQRPSKDSGSMDVMCPVCNTPQKSRGLFFHVKNSHPKEYQEIGWRKLKSDARKVPRKAPEPEEAKKEIVSPDKDFGAWTEETQKTQSFYPSAYTLAIINKFTTSTDPSKFVNEAIINEGKRRGITAALIKTEGGESMELMGTDDKDKEFDRLLKLIAANSQMSQSFTQFSPMTQMIQVMREKVNKGMGLGAFSKDFMQMVLMMKMMEGL